APRTAPTSTSSSTAPGRSPTIATTAPHRRVTIPRMVGAGPTRRYDAGPMHPVERLLNLTALLLEASKPLTFSQIRERIPAYGQRELTAAKRMFERDKDLPREPGIPIA